MRHLARILGLLIAGMAASLPAPRLAAQTPTAESPSNAQASPAAQQMPHEVAELTQRTADAVAKLKPKHVLIAPLRICMLNSQLCDERNEALRAALQKVLPGVSFVNWAAAVKLLPKYGLLPLDAYLGNTLYLVAGQAGADVLVTEGGEPKGKRFELVDTVIDAVHKKQVAQEKIKVPPSVLRFPDHPFVYQDPRTGIYISAFAKKSAKNFSPAKCEWCPSPKYPEDLRQHWVQGEVELRATINAQGEVERVGVVQNSNPEFTQFVLQAVRKWKYKPMVYHGKPVPFRTKLQVTFLIR